MNNDCPNILPIKTPLQNYIYDVNLNTFVPVPQDVFQYAEKRLKNKNVYTLMEGESLKDHSKIKLYLTYE